MTELLYKTTQKIIEDPIFMKIMELVLNCTNNIKKLKVSYNQLSEVLEDLILYLLSN